MNISQNKLSVRNLGGTLVVDIPNGWNDVQKIIDKILEVDGVDYSFRGWDSDKLEAYFRAAQKGCVAIVK